MGAAGSYISTSLDIRVRSGRPTIARGLSEAGPIPLRDPGPAMRNLIATVITFSQGGRSETEADEHPIALAKWTAERWLEGCRREILDRVNRAGRTTLTPADA